MPLSQAEQDQRAAEDAIADQQRLAAQQAKQAAREQKTAAEAARKAALSQQELDMRAQGMIPVTTADGNLHPDPLWEQKQADKAAKAAQEQQAAHLADQFAKEGRKSFVSKVTGLPVALESDEQLAAQKKAKADAARKSALNERITALETAASDPAKKRLPLTAREKLAKELNKTRQEALYGLQSTLQTQSKAVSGGDDYIPFNEAPTPEATAAQERLARLSQPDADLTDDDLALLEANDATKPAAQKLRNIQAILAKDDEAGKFHDTHAASIFDLKLRRDDPAKWAEQVKARRAQMTPEQLQADLEASASSLQERAASLQQQAAPIQQRRALTQQKLDTLAQQAAERRQRGLMAGEIVTFTRPDGTTEDWPADLAATYEREVAMNQEAETQEAATLEQLQALQSDLQAEAALHDEGNARLSEVTKVNQVQQSTAFSNRLRFTPGFEQTGGELEATVAEAQTRLDELNAVYDGDPPPEALDALNADIQQRQQASLAAGQQRQQAAAAAYQGLQTALKPDKDGNAKADVEVRPTVIANLAEALQVEPQEAERLLSDMETLNGNASNAQDVKEKTPEAFAAKAKALRDSSNLTGFAAAIAQTAVDIWQDKPSDPRQTHLLSNGAVVVNQQITAEKDYTAAVNASTATPEAKAEALARFPEIRQNAGAQVRQSFQELEGVYGKDWIKDWLAYDAQRPQDVSPEEWAMRFTEDRKNDSALRRVAQEIGWSFYKGGNQLRQQVSGLVGGITGSEAAMQDATWAGRKAQAMQTSKELYGSASDNFLRAGLLEMTPEVATSIIPAAGGAKLAQLGIRGLAATGAGARLFPALAAVLEGSSTAAQAVKATQTLTRAGLAGASLAGGAQTYGAQISDIYGNLRRQGIEHDDALRMAQTPAILSAGVTAALTALGGASGVERLLVNPASAKTLFAKQFESQMKRLGFVGQKFVEGGLREFALEELPDEIFSTWQSGVASHPDDPNAGRKALAEFLKTLPEFAIATGVLGGAGEGISSYQESSVLPAMHLRPETTATAWSAIENHRAFTPDGGEDPNLTSQEQNRASLALHLAQGGELFDVSEELLNAAGWTRDGTKFKPLKDYAGPKMLDIDTGGMPVIKDAYVKALSEHPTLAPVAKAIGMTETETRNFYAQRDTATPQPPGTPAGQAPASTTGPNANPGPVQTPAGAGPQPAPSGQPPAQSGTPVVSPSPSLPSSSSSAPETPAGFLANHLTERGLPRNQAQTVANAITARPEFAGMSYEQIIAEGPKFRAALDDLGIDGSLNSKDVATNPLKVQPGSKLAKVKAEMEAKAAAAVSQNPSSQQQAKTAAHVAKVRSALGHENNGKLWDTYLEKVRLWARRNPAKAKAILEDSTQVRMAVVGGTTDPARNTTARGDIDLVFDDNIADPDVRNAVSDLQTGTVSPTHQPMMAPLDNNAAAGMPDASNTRVDAKDAILSVLADELSTQNTTPAKSSSAASQSPSPPVSKSPTLPSAVQAALDDAIPGTPSQAVFTAVKQSVQAKEITEQQAAEIVAQQSGAQDHTELRQSLENKLGWNPTRANTAAALHFGDKSKSDIPLAAPKRLPVSQSPSLPVSKTGPDQSWQDPASPLRKHRAWTTEKLRVLSSLRRPAAPAKGASATAQKKYQKALRAFESKQAWTREVFRLLENDIAKHHAFIEAIALGKTARPHLDGNSAAITVIGGKVTLAIDADALIANISDLESPQDRIEATFNEEYIHVAQKKLEALDPKNYGREALIKKWDALPDALRKAVWTSYRNANQRAKSAKDARLPATLSSGQKYHLMQEFNRMLVQNKDFAGQITETVDPASGLMEWVKTMLQKLGDILREMIGRLPKAQQSEIQEHVRRVNEIYQQLASASQGTSAERLGSIPTVTDHQAVATQALTHFMSAKDGIFQPAALAKIWDLLDPSLQRLVFRSKDRDPVTGRFGQQIASRAPKHDLMRDLLAMTATDPKMALAVQEALLKPGPQATQSLNLLDRLFTAFSKQTAQEPAPALASSNRKKKVWHSGSIQGRYDPQKADMDAAYGPGFYTSTSKSRSEGYGKQPARPFIISARRWFDHDAPISRAEAQRIAALLEAPDALDSLFRDEDESGTPIIGEDVWNALKEATSPLMANEALAIAGYDGATYTGNHGKDRDYIVWDANQIEEDTDLTLPASPRSKSPPLPVSESSPLLSALASQSPDARRALATLHSQTLSVLADLIGVRFVIQLPQSPAIQAMLEAEPPQPEDEQKAAGGDKPAQNRLRGRRWLLGQMRLKAPGTPPSLPVSQSQSLPPPAPGAAKQTANRQYVADLLGLLQQQEAADLLDTSFTERRAALDAEDAADHGEASTNLAGAKLRAKLRLQQLATVRARFFRQDNAVRELHQAEQSGRQDVEKAAAMAALATGRIGQRRNGAAWRTIGFTERRQLALLGIGVDQSSSGDQGGYPYTLSRRGMAEARVEFSLEGTPERQIAEEELDWMKEQEADYQTAPDDTTPAYVQNSRENWTRSLSTQGTDHILLKQEALDDLALSYPHTAALIRPEHSAREGFGIPSAQTRRPITQDSSPVNPVTPVNEAPTFTPIAENQSPFTQGSADTPVRSGSPSLPVSKTPPLDFSIPLSKRGQVRRSQFPDADSLAAFQFKLDADTVASARSTPAEIKKAEQRGLALLARLMDETTLSRSDLEKKLLDYHATVVQQAEAASAFGAFTPPSFASSSSSIQDQASSLPAPTGGDIISGMKGQGINRLGPPDASDGWAWYRALERDAALSKLKPGEAQRRARKGDIADAKAKLAWLNENLVSLTSGRSIDEAATELSESAEQQFAVASGEELGQSILTALDARLAAKDAPSLADQEQTREKEALGSAQDFATYAAGSQGQPFTADQLAQELEPEDEIQIGSEYLTVLEADKDTGTLTLDSSRFGSVTVSGTQTLNLASGPNHLRISQSPRLQVPKSPSLPLSKSSPTLAAARAELIAAVEEDTSLGASHRTITVYRGGKSGKGDFPGVFVSLKKTSAAQYGTVTEHQIPADLRLLKPTDAAAKEIIQRWKIIEPNADAFANENPDELWLFPTKLWAQWLKGQGWDGTQLGEDLFLFDGLPAEDTSLAASNRFEGNAIDMADRIRTGTRQRWKEEYDDEPASAAMAWWIDRSGNALPLVMAHEEIGEYIPEAKFPLETAFQMGFIRASTDGRLGGEDKDVFYQTGEGQRPTQYQLRTLRQLAEDKGGELIGENDPRNLFLAASIRKPAAGPEFTRWIAGTQITTPDGKPLRLTHGTPIADFNGFEHGVRRGSYAATKGAFYFTADPLYARNFAEAPWADKPALLHAYIQAKKPLVVKHYGDLAYLTEAKVAAFKADGYDALVFHRPETRFFEVAVFDPEQIWIDESQPLAASHRWSPAKLREEVAKYAYPRPRMEGNRSWLMPDGKWMNVGEHDNAFPPDMPAATVWGYDQMHAAGFVRVAYIPSISALHAEFHPDRLTTLQRRELTNTAIERQAKLHLDPQTPGKLTASNRTRLAAASYVEEAIKDHNFRTLGDLLRFAATDLPAQVFAKLRTPHLYNAWNTVQVENNRPEATRPEEAAALRALAPQVERRFGEMPPDIAARDAAIDPALLDQIVGITAPPPNQTDNAASAAADLASLGENSATADAPSIFAVPAAPDAPAMPDTPEERMDAGWNAHPEDEQLPSAPLIAKGDLDAAKPVNIQGGKSSLLARGIYNRAIAALARHAAAIGDMFFGTGTVTQYIHKAGLGKPNGHASEYSPWRASFLRQVTDPAKVEALARGARAGITELDRVQQAARDAVNGSADFPAAMKAFAGFINNLDHSAISADAWNTIRKRALSGYQTSLKDKNYSAEEFAAKARHFARVHGLKARVMIGMYQALPEGFDLGAYKTKVEAAIAWDKHLLATRDGQTAMLAPPKAEHPGPIPARDDPATTGLYIAAEMLHDNGVSLDLATETKTIEVTGKNGKTQKKTIQILTENLNEPFTGLFDDWDWHTSDRAKNIEKLIRDYHAVFAGKTVHSANSWLLLPRLAQENPGIGFVIDPPYFGVPEMKNGRVIIDTATGQPVRKGTSNYDSTTDIRTPDDLLRLFDSFVLPAWQSGAKFVLTNEWDDSAAVALRLRGATVVKIARQGRKGDTPELVAYNFNPNSGELRPHRISTVTPGRAFSALQRGAYPGAGHSGNLDPRLQLAARAAAEAQPEAARMALQQRQNAAQLPRGNATGGSGRPVGADQRSAPRTPALDATLAGGPDWDATTSARIAWELDQNRSTDPLDESPEVEALDYEAQLQEDADRYGSPSVNEDNDVNDVTLSASARQAAQQYRQPDGSYRIPNALRGINATATPNDAGVAGKGPYYTLKEHVAKMYAGKDGKVIRATATLRKPLIATYGTLTKLQKRLYGRMLTGFEPELSQQFDTWMRQKGYDGAILYEEEDMAQPAEIVTLSAAQRLPLDRALTPTTPGASAAFFRPKEPRTDNLEPRTGQGIAALIPPATPLPVSESPNPLQAAYQSALRGQSSGWLPIKTVWDQFHTQNPAVTPAAFMRSVKEGDDAGTVFLSPPESAATVEAAGPFKLRNASGIMSTDMMVPLSSANRVTNPSQIEAIRAIFPHANDPTKWTHTHEPRSGAGDLQTRQSLADQFGGGTAARPNRTFSEERLASDQKSQRAALLEIQEGNPIDEASAFSPGGHLDSGGEHAVYISDDGRHVTKITLPGLYGYVPTEDVAPGITGDFRRLKLRQATPAEYFLRTALFSELTGIDWQMHGLEFTDEAPDAPVIVSSQPFIPQAVDAQGKPVPVTQPQIDAYMASIGFAPLEDTTGTVFRDTRLKGQIYWHPTRQLLAADARPANFRLTPDQHIVPVDLMLAHYPLAASNRLSSIVYSPNSPPLATQVAAAAARTNTNATPAQREAENYETGKVTVHGLRLSIENPAGSTRSGTDANGKPWSVPMPHHYGRILGTVGRDKDHLDFFLGPNPDSQLVLIVNQRKPGNGHFDEHKVMLGFNTPAEAARGYMASYSPGWKGLQSAVPTTIPVFTHWLTTHDTTQPVTPEQLSKLAKTLPLPSSAHDKPALASSDRKEQTPPMASASGAAQSTEPSPGGLSEAEAVKRGFLEGPFYHGTLNEIPFNLFEPSKTKRSARLESDFVVFLTDNKNAAAEYTNEDNPVILTVRAKIKNPLVKKSDVLQALEDQDAFNPFDTWDEQIQAMVNEGRAVIDGDNLYVSGDYNNDLIDWANENGFDAIRTVDDAFDENGQRIVSWGVLSPENLTIITPESSRAADGTLAASSRLKNTASGAAIGGGIGAAAGAAVAGPPGAAAGGAVGSVIGAAAPNAREIAKTLPLPTSAHDNNVILAANNRKSVEDAGLGETTEVWGETIPSKGKTYRVVPWSEIPESRYKAMLKKHGLPAIQFTGTEWIVPTEEAGEYMFGPHTTGNRESAQRFPLLNAWRDLSELALANQEALEKEMRRESWGGPHGIYTERWKKAQPAILQGKAWAGIATKGFIPSRWESGDSTYLEIYEGNLYQGEEGPPQVVETLWLKSTEFPEEGIARSGHSKSGVSGSFYPRVAFKLSNRKVVSERIRISDHGQVSERAPRRYSIDLRVYGEDLARRAFRKIIEANKDRVWAGIDELVAEEWEISRDQTQKRQSRPLTGQAGESSQDMTQKISGPSKTGAPDNRTGAEEVNILAKASPSPSLPLSQSPALAASNRLGTAITQSASAVATGTERTLQVANTLTAALGIQQPLATFGSNNLDKRLAAQLDKLAGPKVRSAKAAVETWLDKPEGLAPTIKGLVDQLLPNALIPREWLALHHEMQRKTAFGQETANDLIRALSGNPRLSDLAYPKEFAENPAARAQLFDAMEGRIPMSSLPPEMQRLGQRLRDLLRQTGSELVRQGLMNPDTFEELQSNGWMPRYTEDEARESAGSFLAAFKLGVRDLLQQRSTAYHIVDTTRKDKTGQFVTVSRDEGGKRNRWRFRDAASRDAFYHEFVRKQTLDMLQDRNDRTVADMLAPLSRGDKMAMRDQIKSLTTDQIANTAKLSPMLAGIVKQAKKHQYDRFAPKDPFEPAKLVKDPVYAVARYTLGQTHNAATMELLRKTAQHPEWVSDVAITGFEAIPDANRFGPLAGKHVRKDIAQQILDLVDVPNAALQFYDAILRKWKAGKLVWNPGSHIRDAVGNTMFAFLSGSSIWNPGNWPHYQQAIAALRNGGKDFAELVEMQVIGGDAYTGLVKDRLKGILPDPKTVENYDPGFVQRLMFGFGATLHGSHEFMSSLRRLPDDFFKAAAYFKAKAEFLSESPSLPVSESSAKAAQHVRKWFPYYDRLGQSGTTRAVGRFVNPFVSFFRESTRILGTAVVERPLALTAALAFPALITAASAIALGLDDDDMEEIQKDMAGKGKLFATGTSLFSMLLPFRSAQGAVQQFDISAIMPFADLLGTRVVVTEADEDPWNRFWRGIVSGGPVLSLVDAWRHNEDAFTRRPIAEFGMTPLEKITAYTKHAAGVALPPLAPGGTAFNTLMRAGDRSTNKTLEKYDPAQAVVRSVVGLNVKNATPDIYRQAHDFVIEQGGEVAEGMDYGSTTPASRARKALYAQLVQDKPNLTAIKNILNSLDKMGHPVRTEQDVNRFLFYRNPLMVVGAIKQKGISAAEAQARFRASLTGESRAALENTLQEFRRIQAKAPLLVRQASSL